MHLRKLPSGTWRVSVKHAGERRTATARTRGEAQRLGAELLLEMGGGGRQAERNVTVGDMLAAHAADPDNGWSAAFRVDAGRVIAKLHATAPKFVARPIRDVTPAVLVGLWRQLEAAGWSRWRVKRIHTVLSTAWVMAVRLDWARTIPCRDAPPPIPQRQAIAPPSDDQVASTLRAVAETRKGRRGGNAALDALAVRCDATLGIRRGEVVGLQWSAIDLAAGEVLICRSITVIPGDVIVTETKAGQRSHRRLALDPVTVKALKAWRVEQKQQAYAAAMPAPVWVFSDDGGATPWRPDRLGRTWRRNADRVGANGVKLHHVRHKVATDMLNDGESVHDVAGQLGNTVAVIESTYRHWLPARGRESVDRRAARLDSTA